MGVILDQKHDGFAVEYEISDESGKKSLRITKLLTVTLSNRSLIEISLL